MRTQQQKASACQPLLFSHAGVSSSSPVGDGKFETGPTEHNHVTRLASGQNRAYPAAIMALTTSSSLRHSDRAHGVEPDVSSRTRRSWASRSKPEPHLPILQSRDSAHLEVLHSCEALGLPQAGSCPESQDFSEAGSVTLVVIRMCRWLAEELL